jgi:hypothetical protein
MASEFANNFLDRMIRETSDEPKTGSKAELIRVTREVPAQKTKKPKQRQEPEPVVEEVEEENWDNQESAEEEIDEDFAERAINYATVVLRTVRKTFESKKEREIVLEALYSTLKLHFKTKGKELAEETNYRASASISTRDNTLRDVAVPPVQVDKTNVHPGGRMSEADWMKIPTITYTDYTNFDAAAVEAEAAKTEAAAAIRQPGATTPTAPVPTAPTVPQIRRANEAYNPTAAAAPVVVTREGQPTLDVKKMSPQAMHEIRVLAGIE